MSARIHITPVSPDEVGRQIFDRLVAVHPEGLKSSPTERWLLTAPLRSIPLQRCLEILRTAGLRPVSHYPSNATEVRIMISHQYSRSDLETAELLQTNDIPNADALPSEAGPTRLINYKSKKSIMYSTSLFIADWVRQIFEEHDLAGIEYLPTLPVSRRDFSPLDWGDHAPFWELRPTTTLPPTTNRRRHEDGSQALRDDPHARIVENLFEYQATESSDNARWLAGLSYDCAQLHYSRSDLGSLRTIDFAWSWEVISGWGTRYHIVSQRFYQICQKHKIRCGFEPVVIDD